MSLLNDLKKKTKRKIEKQAKYELSKKKRRLNWRSMTKKVLKNRQKELKGIFKI